MADIFYYYLLRLIVQSLEPTQCSTGTPSLVIPSLRPYQQRSIADVYTHIRAGAKRILLFSPTGSGKTIMAARMIADAVSRGRRVIMLVHRDPLVDQTVSKLCDFGIVNCGFIKAGWQENRDALVQIASVQTLPNRNWWHHFPADVVILDECHITSYASVVQQMMTKVYPQAIYLGLTASPWRLNKHESMGDIFKSLVCAPMPYELIDQGHLVKPSYFSVEQADLEKVGTVNGDFDEGELALACDRPELIQQIVQDWQRIAYGRRTIAFTVNVSHSQHLCAAFQAAGIPAAHVDGQTPVKITKQIYQQVASGKILVLSSCMKLTEGFDLPSISAVLLCRPTQSKALFFQMVGRGLRLSPETDKIDCVVLDPAGNIQRHGFVEDLKEISLDSGQERQQAEAPQKVCPADDNGCGAVLYAFQTQCPHCKYVFPRPKKVYFIPEIQQQLSESDFERYEFYRQQLRSGYHNNFAPGWAAMTFKEKYGHWPPNAWARQAVFGDSYSPAHQVSYHSYLKALAQRKDKPDCWITKYMEMEFGFINVTL